MKLNSKDDEKKNKTKKTLFNYSETIYLVNIRKFKVIFFVNDKV